MDTADKNDTCHWHRGNSPDMNGGMADITDENWIYARIGYWQYLIWSKQNPAPGQRVWDPVKLTELVDYYEAMIKTANKRLRVLRTARVRAQKARRNEKKGAKNE